jgi:NADH-quinone oxidoreductase subunit H
VAGYHTEYSGMRFSFFFLSEYANMFVVAAIATTFFLGGWLPPFSNGWGALLSIVFGVVAAVMAYGATKRGFDATVAFIVGSGIGVLAGVFLGGGEVHEIMPPPGVGRAIVGLFWFSSKCFALIFLMIWLRWTLPRYRVDQLMDLCWKKLTPLALLNLLVIGILETRHEWMALLLKGGGH